MKRIQAGILAAALLLSLSACSMRDEWTDDSSYTTQRQNEKNRDLNK